jgi:hypothetical protein
MILGGMNIAQFHIFYEFDSYNIQIYLSRKLLINTNILILLIIYALYFIN